MAIGISDEVIRSALVTPELNDRMRRSQAGSVAILTSIKELCAKLEHQGLIWVDAASEREPSPFLLVSVEEAKTWVLLWQETWTALSEQSGGAMREHWIPETLRCIAKVAPRNFPEVHLYQRKGC